MQRPTHPRLHVRDARDAHTIFEAVRIGVLQPVQRRLNEMERSMYIRSGAVFMWEESDDEAGLKRWTDGRTWSQSRLREEALFYDERLPCETSNQPNFASSQAYRFVDGVSRTPASSSAMTHFDRSSQQPLGLVKQAYSAWVLLDPNARPRKWHQLFYLRGSAKYPYGRSRSGIATNFGSTGDISEWQNKIEGRRGRDCSKATDSTFPKGVIVHHFTPSKSPYRSFISPATPSRTYARSPSFVTSTSETCRG